MHEAMRHDRREPDDSNRYQADSADLILSSHLRLLQRPLLCAGTADADEARRLYLAPFVVLAHDAAADPVFFYANRSAQRLFEMSWLQLVSLPSRRSAQAPAREDRQRLLERVARQGYIDDYSGVRISASGKRFRIARATVWNLLDGQGRAVGQAAAFADWTMLA